MAAIWARDVTIRYRRSRRAQIDAASFRVEGGITALVGRNGAGKSTILKALVGLVRVESGELGVLDHELGPSGVEKSLLAKIGYLPQEFGYINSFTAKEFVEYGAWLKRVPSKKAAGLAQQALDGVGLGAELQTKMGRLSGGMRRRAGIAQAIVHDPSLLILDEPTTGLDPEQRVRFRELIRSVGVGRTVVMTSHLIEDVKALASQVIVLNSGRLAFEGSVDELEHLGRRGGMGDTPLERGYISVLQVTG